MAGGDENAASDMTALIRNLDAIRQRTGAHVLAVHHAGKDTAKGARGHSSLRAATDTEIELRQEKDLRLAVVTKQRDHIGDETFAFRLKSVPLGIDDDGDDVSSCIVEVSEEEPITRKDRASGKPFVALQALSEALIEFGTVLRGPNYPTCPVVHVDQWGEMCRRHGLSETDTVEARKKAFQRAKGALIEKGLVRQFESFVWKTEPDA